MQEELLAANRKIAQHEAENARRIQEDERRDQELRESKARIEKLEKMHLFMQNNDPRFAAYLAQPSTIEPPPTDTPPAINLNT